MKFAAYILFSFVLCTAASAQDRPTATERTDAYYNCVKRNALAFGTSNQEPAATVLRAAYSECEFEHAMAVLSKMNSLVEVGIIPSASSQTHLEDDLRRTAGDRATAELLKARATR